MSRKKKSRIKGLRGFKSVPPQTARPSIGSAPDIASLVAILRTPDELEHRSWQAAITVKNATIWMLIATFAILVVTIVLPFAVEIFKARFANTHSRKSAEPGPAQAKVESSVSPPVSYAATTISTPQTADSKAGPVGIAMEISNETQSKRGKRTPNSSPLVVSYLKQARFRYHRNQYQDALAECEKALSLEPHNQAAIALKKQIRTAAQAMSENDKPKQ